ncbi:MAG: MotA/TolQ/ExbB proton channel family protein [Waddliaceae bacterium]|jgi:biopolymer transport protein ExbB|nr:MotA/TolQ/ExbB proton channel family protein [Waddliaceae bacterium]MBT3579211.1 MotA/TolQ/ExbB proton channel family protein [Waddliaceae bacterium]MBT4444289.1 MotA/TolQ/ExbB proton channel family protein [Waddliaceae bacterium]MBT6928910.1 MotA/TolQ/ExbB proton channel family protein [Waddliaceae bacterium]MBT7264157.1 MotA/TolQ/ExbB proton channel family protein [Waddliaceae bacterium]
MFSFDTIAFTEIWKHISTIANWNLILVLIFGCSVVSFAIFIERMLLLKRSEIDTNAFVIDLRKSLRYGNYVEAIASCENTGGPLSNIVRSGLMRHNRKQDEIEDAMEVTGMLEIALLEKNTRILSIIAHIAPLIGLLGTVLGFIRAFGEMRLSGLMDISTTNIGEAMEYALVTTAAGLVVAIPTFVAYNYLVSRVDRFVLEVQTTSSTIVDVLVNQREDYEI